jgi:hypothetical protein
VLLVSETEQLTGAVGVGHAVGAGGDAFVPSREHHVLRRAAGVEAGAAANDDGHRKLGTEDVRRRVNGLCDALAQLGVFEDDKAPRLPVLRAAGDAPGLEDAVDGLVRDLAVRVLALVALARDNEKRIDCGSLTARIVRLRRAHAT